MGRPVKKSYMGPYTLPNVVPQSQGSLIQGTAWFPDLNGTALAFLDKQVGPTSYLFRNAADYTMLSGPCELVPGDVTGPGQASVLVYPYLYTDAYGAEAHVANISIASVTVDNPGTSGFLAGNFLAINTGVYAGGEGIVEVLRFTGTNFAVSGGSSFTTSSTISFNLGTGGTNPLQAQVDVTTVDLSGAITGFNVIVTGSSTGTASTSGGSFDGTTGGGTGAVITFDTILDKAHQNTYGNPLAIANVGSYTKPTSYNADIYYLTGGGVGATINVSAWFSNSIVVTSGGTGYSQIDPPPVLIYDPFMSGVQTAVATVNGGAVTDIEFTGTRRTFPQSEHGAHDSGRMFPAVAIDPLAVPTAIISSYGPASWDNYPDIVNGGSAYTQGDTLTLVGGAYIGEPATIYINSVDGTGAIGTFYWNYTTAEYTAFPANPVSFTGSTGTGFQININNKQLAPYNITVTNPGGAPGYNAWGPEGPPVFVTPSGPNTGPEGAIFYPVGSPTIGITGVSTGGPEGQVGVYYANTAVQIGFVPLQHEHVPLPQAQKIMDRTVLTWDNQIYSWYLISNNNILPDPTWAYLQTGGQQIQNGG